MAQAMAGAMGMVDPEEEVRRRERQREYLYFLDDAGSGGVYAERLRAMMECGGCRLVVNVNHLRAAAPERAAGLLGASFEELQAFQAALKEIVANTDPDYATRHQDFFVGLEGSFGTRHVNPRSLKAAFLGNLVCCEGIVTKASLVRPKVVRSVHYCPATKKTTERRYTDLTSYDAFPSANHYPTEDENKNPLETEYGLSSYKDHQSISMQELPEKAPAGQLPRSLDIVADDDLADACKPGDRIRVVGVFRCLPNKQNGFTNGTFRTVLIANNIILMSKETETEATAEDMALIKKFRTMKKIDHFEEMAQSLAPSICGQTEVKRAILSLLLGGVEKVLPNGTRLRGDINVLLIGDPSVAKSQCLRYVLHSAPRAVATTGRGSSGVGLTAAVTTDSETGERRLEAGAMVLADRGVVCIDEFDKMSDQDRTAIHEVMEQGRVTIAKAGIQAKLNARCSVLAAANPVYGKYDQMKSPMENIGMQDSLLSRFDLCFVLLDEHQAERDAKIAAHVVKLHSYREPGEEEGAVLPMGSSVEVLSTLARPSDAARATQLYEENTSWTAAGKSQKILSLPFMRKYINLAKQTKPQLTQEASDFISERYCELRDFDDKKSERERTTPVTARMLETLIRLATAHAKARMAPKVTRADAEAATDLLHFACFKEKPKERLDEERRGKRPRKGADSDGEETPAEAMDADDDDEVSLHRPPRRQPQAQPQEAMEEEEASQEPAPAAKRPRTEVPSISVERYAEFKRQVRKVFDAAASENETVPLGEALEAIQKAMGSAGKFGEGELAAATERLADDNIAMVADGNLILI